MLSAEPGTTIRSTCCRRALPAPDSLDSTFAMLRRAGEQERISVRRLSQSLRMRRPKPGHGGTGRPEASQARFRYKGAWDSSTGASATSPPPPGRSEALARMKEPSRCSGRAACRLVRQQGWPEKIRSGDRAWAHLVLAERKASPCPPAGQPQFRYSDQSCSRTTCPPRGRNLPLNAMTSLSLGQRPPAAQGVSLGEQLVGLKAARRARSTVSRSSSGCSRSSSMARCSARMASRQRPTPAAARA